MEVELEDDKFECSFEDNGDNSIIQPMYNYLDGGTF